MSTIYEQIASKYVKLFFLVINGSKFPLPSYNLQVI